MRQDQAPLVDADQLQLLPRGDARSTSPYTLSNSALIVHEGGLGHRSSRSIGTLFSEALGGLSPASPETAASSRGGGDKTTGIGGSTPADETMSNVSSQANTVTLNDPENRSSSSHTHFSVRHSGEQRESETSRSASIRIDSSDSAYSSKGNLAPISEGGGYKSLSFDDMGAQTSNLRDLMKSRADPDFVQKKADRHDVSRDCKRAFCLGNLALGVGFLSFNTVFYQSGWLWTSILLITSTVLLVFTSYVVGKSSVYYKVHSLRELVDRVCGGTWGVFYLWTITLLHFSVSVICVAVGGHVGEVLLPGVSKEVASLLCMAVVVGICIPLSFKTNANDMVMLNVLGVGTAVAITLNLIWLGSNSSKTESLSVEVGGLSDWFGPIGVVVFSLMMHSAIPTVMNDSYSNVTPLIGSTNNFEAETLMHGSQILRYVSSSKNVFPIMFGVGTLTFTITLFAGIFGSMKFLGVSIIDIIDEEAVEHPSLNAMIAVACISTCPLLAIFTFAQFRFDKKYMYKAVVLWYSLVFVTAFAIDVYGPRVIEDIVIILGFSTGALIALTLPGILLRDVNGPFRNLKNMKQVSSCCSLAVIALRRYLSLTSSFSGIIFL
jgi:hypothetical protein